MKVTPSNQTLILASERGRSGGAPAAGLARVLRDSAVDGVLQRVTILAARPDSTLVYLQADYASDPARYADDGQSEPPGGAASSAHPSGAGVPALPSATAVPSAGSRGIELYASTQRLGGPSGAAVQRYGRIDVHA